MEKIMDNEMEAGGFCLIYIYIHKYLYEYRSILYMYTHIYMASHIYIYMRV